MSVRSVNDHPVINGRRYRTLSIDRASKSEGWAFWQAVDNQTGFRFRIAEFAGSRPELELARRKAEQLARLKIHGFPLICDICLAQEKLFIVTDWTPGLTLREYLTSRRGPARDDLPAMAEYGRQLCTILSRLHPGFVHRGLRPDNIILAGGRIALAEPGFSCMPAGVEREELSYRAPEQTAAGRGEAVGCRTDIYSFGLILAEMLTGSRPGACGNPAAAGMADAWSEVPAGLKEIVLHCSQPLPQQRPRNIDEVKCRLTEWLLYRRAKLLSTGVSETAATLTEAAETSQTAAGSAAARMANGMRRLRRLAGKRSLWALVSCLLLLPPVLLAMLFHPPQPPMPAVSQTITAIPPAVSRQEEPSLLASALEDLNRLLAAYGSAKVPGSPEKTVRNYRGVEAAVESLRLSLSAFAAPGGELADVLALELDSCENLQAAAGIFADYLEGERKTTPYVDWVEEADSRYRRALELREQAAAKLSRAQR